MDAGFAGGTSGTGGGTVTAGGAAAGGSATAGGSTTAGGSAQPILNKGDFSRLEIPLPPLVEQKAIAAVLGALDDKIECNRRMNATLEAMARALFQSWFVDFDPVRAKLDGRLPAALDPATAALFPEHLEDSPLGHIPKGWTAQRLPDAIEVNPRRKLHSGTIAPLSLIHI